MTSSETIDNNTYDDEHGYAELQQVIENDPVLQSVFVGNCQVCIRNDEQLQRYRAFIERLKVLTRAESNNEYAQPMGND